MLDSTSDSGALARARTTLAVAREQLAVRGPLEVRIDELWAGETRLSGDTDFVDHIQATCGFGCTIFLGNTRVTTTASVAGGHQRAVGTQANASITQKVYRLGQDFAGISRTLGQDWVIAYSPLREATGRIIGMIAAFRELHSFLDALHTLDDLTEGVLIAGPEGRLLDLNRSAADMLGAAKDELRWRALQGVTGGEMAELRSGQRPEFERTWRRMDGHTFPVQMQLQVPDTERVLVIVRDFSEQHAARERLRALNGELASLNASLERMVSQRTRDLRATLAQRDATTQHLIDGFLSTDESGRVTQTNPALARILGCLDPNWAGRPIDVVNPSLAALCHRVLQIGSGTSGELVLPEGRIAEAVVSPIQVDGSCIGTVGLVRDVTESRELDRMKADFIATVSHELKTPMTSVIGFAKISGNRLTDKVAPALPEDATVARRAVTQVTSNLQLIVGEGERLGRLIDDVLDLSRIEAGEEAWRFEALEAHSLVHHAVQVSSALFDGAVALTAHAEEGLPCVEGDASRLLQVLLNLISNAAKFTAEGSVRVEATAVPNGVEFRVEDTGKGIAEDQRAHIFKRFKQAGDPLADKPRGTGLGLAISARIVAGHGSRITVESEVGRGSRFAFVLSPASDPDPE